MRTPAFVIAAATALLVAGVGASYGLALSGDHLLEVPEERHPQPVAPPSDSPPQRPDAAPTVAPREPDHTPTASPADDPEPVHPQPAQPPPGSEQPEPGRPQPEQLVEGDNGPAVAALQLRLHELGLDPGAADGQFGRGTTYAVYALQALHGLTQDGVVGPAVQEVLDEPLPLPEFVPGAEATRVEVDLASQVLIVRHDGVVVLVTHVSTGSGERYCVDGECMTADTPTGRYQFTWRVDGWRTSRLGQLYNPVYFNGGIAVHGSAAGVPNYPASHGCVRIPMHIAEYFPDLVDQGDPIYVT